MDWPTYIVRFRFDKSIDTIDRNVVRWRGILQDILQYASNFAPHYVDANIWGKY